jgi:hypothetical protein
LKYRKVKTGPLWEWEQVRGGKVNEECEGGQLWCMYFVHLDENRTMKPVEIVLRREG